MGCGCARRRELRRQLGTGGMLQHEALRLAGASQQLFNHLGRVGALPPQPHRKPPPKNGS